MSDPVRTAFRSLDRYPALNLVDDFPGLTDTEGDDERQTVTRGARTLLYKEEEVNRRRIHWLRIGQIVAITILIIGGAVVWMFWPRTPAVVAGSPTPGPEAPIA